MNPIETLELQPGCSEEDVRDSFRRLSFLYHPDKHPNDKEAEESFKEITNAYELIKKDPSILKSNTSVSNSGDTIYVEMDITIEDLYFDRKKSINIKKIIPCPICSGFGTDNIEDGLCHLCKGTGNIDNKILGFFKKDSICICPSCGGLGVKKGYICKICKGKKIKEEAVEYNFYVKLSDYHNKCIILNEKGNHYPNSSPGDIIIKLNIKEHPGYTIEKDKLCVNYGVTPTQDLIGDECKIKIFGNIFKFKVPLINNRIILEDNRKGFLNPKKILIRTCQTKPILNDKIIAFYKKILDLEKEITSCF